MKTMAERLQRDKVYDLIGIDLFKESWPDELSLFHIIKLYSTDKAQELIKAFKDGLEEATFNKDIEARRLAYLRYHCQSAGEWKEHQLETQEIEKVECAYRLKEKHKIFNENYLIFRLLNSAEIRLNLEPFDIYKPIAIYRENYITLDWFYSAQALNLWLEAVGESPSELLTLWLVEKGCTVSNLVAAAFSNNLKERLDVRSLFVNFTSMPDLIAEVMFAAVEKYIKENNEYPTQNQLWYFLPKSPPTGYEVKRTNNKKILLVEDEELERKGFRTRWTDYTRGSKVIGLPELTNISLN